MGIKRIITHGSRAHFDEITALSIILSGDTVPVYRRDPTDEELEDPEVIVVDVGQEYSPEKNNFDHHQSQALPSSFVLVAGEVDMGEETLADMMARTFSWWGYKDTLDTCGPTAAAKQIGIDEDIDTRPMQSPMEGFLRRKFQETGEDDRVPDEVVQLISEYGLSLVERTVKFHQKLDTFREEGDILHYEDVPVFVIESQIADSAVLTALREEMGSDLPAFEATITRDPRSGDLAVYRYEDEVSCPLRLYDAAEEVRLNSGEKAVHFAHHGQFLATVPSICEAASLVETAQKMRLGEYSRPTHAA